MKILGHQEGACEFWVLPYHTILYHGGSIIEYAQYHVVTGTIGKSSEITISLNFTAEHAESAEFPSLRSPRLNSLL